MRLFRRRKQGDRIEFSRRVASDYPGAGYTARDRFRDFAAVFGTPQGRRVLAQILVWCQVWERSYVPGDANETILREGMRNIGLRIMETINIEPVDLPDETQQEDDHG